jgi:hypothetical protein
MNTKKVFFAFFTLVLMFAVMLPVARADAWDQATKLTFSQPVEIPGEILPAGSYLFVLLDGPGSRDVVRIFNADRNRVYATLITTPSSRIDPTDDTVISFAERPSGQPEAIITLFYPGELIGHQFRYSGQEDRELAGDTKDVVTASPSGSTSNQAPASGN